MSLSFAMKGSTKPTFHGAHSHTKLEIRGNFYASGPQPVGDDGGVPQWVADAFAYFPSLREIALNGDTHGVVYSRFADEVPE
jgi:hypothetical protein